MMKKKYIRFLMGSAAVFVLAAAWMWNGSRPKLLENDPAYDTEIIEEMQVPLAGAPEAFGGTKTVGKAIDSYEGLEQTEIEYVQEVFALVNEAREDAGLPGLELDISLRQAAQTRAEECMGSFSHTRPNGTSYKTAITEAGLDTGYTGENVATGYVSAEHVMQGWMRSSGHRANILNKKFTRIGVGLVENTGNRYGGYAWAQLFVE